MTDFEVSIKSQLISKFSLFVSADDSSVNQFSSTTVEWSNQRSLKKRFRYCSPPATKQSVCLLVSIHLTFELAGGLVLVAVFDLLLN